MMSTTIDEELGKNLTKEQITEDRKFMKKVLGLNSIKTNENIFKNFNFMFVMV